MSHKGNGETDFLMSGQLFILTHSFTLLAYSIIHSLNHTFTRTFINSITHPLCQIDDDYYYYDDDDDDDDDVAKVYQQSKYMCLYGSK